MNEYEYQELLSRLAQESDASPEEIAEEIASKREHGARCAWCSKPAEYLCDFVIGFTTDHQERTGEVPPDGGKGVQIGDRQMEICAAPLCGTCRHEMGMIFLPAELGGAQSRDRCPCCYERRDLERCGGPYGPTTLITNKDAEEFRRKTWRSRLQKQTFKLITE